MIKYHYREDFDEKLMRDGELCNVLENKSACSCCGRGSGVVYWIALKSCGKVHWFEQGTI